MVRLKGQATMAGSFDKTYADPVNIPVSSRGPCQGITLRGTVCNIYGDLGDGLCQKCWDRLKTKVAYMSKKQTKEVIKGIIDAG